MTNNPGAMPEPLPCPFPHLGEHRPSVICVRTVWRVQCCCCGATGGAHNSKAEAIAFWNGRPGEDAAFNAAISAAIVQLTMAFVPGNGDPTVMENDALQRIRALKKES